MPGLFVQRCNGMACHGGGASSAAGLDLISPGVEDRIADAPSATCSGLLANLSNPRESLLYTKVTEPVCGVRMPVGLEPLDEAELTCMESWISGLLPPGDDCMDCECEPGVVEECYSGPEGTADIGRCKRGTHTCQTSGLGWLGCEGEATPLGENCLTPDIDEDCDGATPECTEVWARHFGDPNDQAIRSVVVDDDGSIYSFGDFEGVVSFGEEPLTAEPSDPLRQDLVIAKHDLYGNPMWSRRFGDSSTQIGLEMVMDGEGNLVFVGRMYGTIDLGGGTLHASGGNDVLVFKLDHEGNHVWSRIFGGNEPDRAARLAFDAEGNVMLTGAFAGTVDFSVAEYTSSGERDAFFTKLDRDTGEPFFAMRIGGPGDDFGFGVDVDPKNGDVVIAGRFGGALTIGGEMLDHAGDLDIYVARLDGAGVVVWAKSFGGPGRDEIHDLRLQQNGDIVLIGAMSESVDFGGGALVSAGARDLFLVTLDGEGSHSWSSSYGDALDQFEVDGIASWLTLVLDADGDIHVGGTLYGVLDFGDGGQLAAKNAWPDVFHAQFDAAGDYIGGWSFGGPGSDFGHDIAVAASGHVIHCGRSLGSKIDFGESGQFESAGRSDGFVVKFAPL